MPIVDYSERREAILTEGHAFVSASAGTGKTHTLTLRAFYLLCRLGGDALFSRSRHNRMTAAREAVRSLVLTTFTRKAAAEMQTRLFRYLDLIVGADDLAGLRREEKLEKDPLFLEIIEELLEIPSRGDFGAFRRGAECLAELASEMNITTLHGYAAAILRRHPVESAIPPWCRFAEEEEDDLADFEDRLVDRWWQTEAVTNPAVRRLLDQALEEVTLSQLRTWLKLIAANPAVCRRLDKFPPVPDERINAVSDALRWLAQALQSLTGAKLTRTGRDLEELLSGPLESISWRRMCRFLHANEKYLFSGDKKSLNSLLEAAPDPVRVELGDFPAIYSAALSRALKGDVSVSWNSWASLANHFAEWQRSARISDLGLLTFDDMIIRCVELLREHPAVRLAEHQRIRALLVDEFQDTDRTQLQLLALLLEPDPADSHEVLGFFVGDSKQSIYRFRGADIPSVNRFRDHYGSQIGGGKTPRSFQLQTSFRSSEQLIQFTNQVFSDDIPLATVQEQLIPFRDRGLAPPEIVLPATDPHSATLSAQVARELASRALLATIGEWMDTPGHQFKEIMVLTRSNHELDLILPAMLHAGIPVVASGAKTFYRHPEVLDILNLLIALHHPDDSLASAATLRGPIVDLSDGVLDRLLRELKAAEIFHGSCELPDWIPPPAAAKIAGLRELARLRSSHYLPDWLNRVRRHFPVGAYTDPRDCEGRTIARIDRVLNSFQRASLGGTTPPVAWLVQQRQRAAEIDRWDAELGEDVALTDETVDAVRALTIHKAKGLESPLVILFDWSGLLQSTQTPRRESPALLTVTGEDGDLMHEFSLPWSDIQILSPGYSEALGLEHLENQKEACNLAYVAATRARDHAVLLIPPRKEAQYAVEKATEAAARGIASFRIAPCADRQIAAPPTALQTFHMGDYQRLWESREEQPGRRLTYHPSADEETSKKAMIGSRRNASPDTETRGSMIGRLVHGYLERYLEDPGLSRAKLKELAAEFGFEPGTGEVSGSASILERFFSAQTFDHQDRAHVTRVCQGRILARELPVFLKSGDKCWNGVIDLVLDEGSVVTGIDYKTGSAPGRLSQIYAQQEHVYCEALKRSLPGSNVTFEFWWLA